MPAINHLHWWCIRQVCNPITSIAWRGINCHCRVGIRRWTLIIWIVITNSVVPIPSRSAIIHQRELGRLIEQTTSWQPSQFKTILTLETWSLRFLHLCNTSRFHLPIPAHKFLLKMLLSFNSNKHKLVQHLKEIDVKVFLLIIRLLSRKREIVKHLHQLSTSALLILTSSKITKVG